ncbi:DUF1700 domain-containing protein [Ruminococcus sp.]|uniref:DUF1700 domain-containing protein n=1 Tax=Ruminococcus sp. TaxID=41978 RepID=UPI003F0B2B4A
MNKSEFIAALEQKLKGLPREDVEQSIAFYEEMIQDRMEEGLSEEEATAAIGSVEEIAAQTLADIPLAKLVKEKVTPSRRFKAWEILLLVLGSPLWLPLLLAAVCVVAAVCITFWAVILSLYAVDLSFAVSGIAGIVGTFLFAYASSGNLAGALLFLGAGMLCAGISIFLFLGCNQITRGLFLLNKNMLTGIKSLFVRKEEAQ